MSLTLLPPDADVPVLVGFSGGLDSTVLLHWLAQFPQQRRSGLRAVHVHHGLMPQADDWSAHCRKVCSEWGVPLHCERATVDRDTGEGLEAAARHARRAVFAHVLQNDERLALAHHRDDQAETFLLRALRGSGVDGLAAMRGLTPFAAGQLWRPLLDTPRAQLLAYAEAHGLRWIDDPSNADDTLDRNFLRLRVLPLLRRRWPHADAAFARSAELSAEASALLEADDAPLLLLLTNEERALSLDGLREHPAPRRARLLRHWVAQHDAPPLPAQGIAILERELQVDHHDRATCFAWGDVEIRRWRDHLYLCGAASMTWPEDTSLRWQGTEPLLLPDGGWLSLSDGAPPLDECIHVRPRRGGERIVLPGRQHSHQLKHLLQDACIPPWRRASLPLLFADDGELLAAGDAIVSARLHAWLDFHGARLCWTPPPMN